MISQSKIIDVPPEVNFLTLERLGGLFLVTTNFKVMFIKTAEQNLLKIYNEIYYLLNISFKKREKILPMFYCEIKTTAKTGKNLDIF